MPRPKGVKDEFFAMTCMEIGREIGVSHSRVQQILDGALQKLRTEFSRRGITEMPATGQSAWQELMSQATGDADEEL